MCRHAPRRAWTTFEKAMQASLKYVEHNAFTNKAISQGWRLLRLSCAKSQSNQWKISLMVQCIYYASCLGKS